MRGLAIQPVALCCSSGRCARPSVLPGPVAAARSVGRPRLCLVRAVVDSTPHLLCDDDCQHEERQQQQLSLSLLLLLLLLLRHCTLLCTAPIHCILMTARRAVHAVSDSWLAALTCCPPTGQIWLTYTVIGAAMRRRRVSDVSN